MLHKRSFSSLHQQFTSDGISYSPCYSQQTRQVSSKRSNNTHDVQLYETVIKEDQIQQQNSIHLAIQNNNYTPTFLNQNLVSTLADQMSSNTSEILSPVDNFADLELEFETSNVVVGDDYFYTYDNYNEIFSSPISHAQSTVIQCQDSMMTTSDHSGSKSSKKKLINDYFRQSSVSPIRNFKMKDISSNNNNNNSTINISNRIDSKNNILYQPAISNNNKMKIKFNNSNFF